jgi:hypothetical protein
VEENASFCRDRRRDEEMLRFQLMQGGHKFMVDHLHRFAAIMVFSLDDKKPKKSWSLPLLVNTFVRRLFDLVTPRGYLVWLVWNHIGVISWKYSMLDRAMTTVELDDAPLPPHIAASIRHRYGDFEYCRYFAYGGEHTFEVYWVVLRRDGRIVIAEAADSWIGRWGHFLDVNW